LRLPEPLRALIFDVDGTLAETELAHLAAFNAAFAAAGLGWRWSEAEYARLLATTGGKERIARHARERGLAVEAAAIAALHADKTRRYAALVAEGSVRLRPGVAGLLAAARGRGARLAVATTTTPANVEALVRATMGVAAAEVFEVVAAGDAVGAKKPAPDVYLLALAELGLGPGGCVAVEDSRNGLLAAKAAGLFTVVCPSRFSAGEDFAGADLLLPSLEGLLGEAALSRP
jgi:HAD superfamily hydrolase (TIGR01509 family)